MALANRLNDKKVKAAHKPGMHGDGNNLYLMVDRKDPELRSWVFRFEIHGKRRHMGLGAFPKVSLADARKLRDAARKLVNEGTDPIVARGQVALEEATTVSVKQATEAYIEAQAPKWKTSRHAEQTRQRLENYVWPIIGHLPIAEIGLAEIELVLNPIWHRKNPTASRVRQYLEDTLNWAIARKVRKNESNPAEMKKLKWSLPEGVHTLEHHPSLPYSEAPAFLSALRAQDGVKARALEFIMLTAVRVADVTGGGKAHSEPMKWSHINMTERVWAIPDTKMGRPHTVPLSKPAMRLLDEMRREKDPESDIVFRGAKRGSVLNDATLRYLLRGMGLAGIATTHGMRATFKTWATECTAYPKDVVEMALAHAQTALDAAYMRGELLDKRRRLMGAWADYLEGRTVSKGATVLALRA
jgi:integrase